MFLSILQEKRPDEAFATCLFRKRDQHRFKPHLHRGVDPTAINVSTENFRTCERFADLEVLK
jgi:hypothetical protein